MDETYLDPVCGMELNLFTAEDSVEYRGETYFFCCEDCQEIFEDNPAEYVERLKSKIQ